MIRKECGEKDKPLFDLALIESTYPDGSRALYSRFSLQFYGLVPEYTDDGGHLNNLGRFTVAEQLIHLLSRVQ
jgi:hypothetical protein